MAKKKKKANRADDALKKMGKISRSRSTIKINIEVPVPAMGKQAPTKAYIDNEADRAWDRMRKGPRGRNS